MYQESELFKLSLLWYSMLLLLNQEKLQSPRTNHHVQQSVKDPLLTAKLNFFLMIAKEIQPFLTKNQADKPLLPFFVFSKELLLSAASGRQRYHTALD